MIQSATYTLEQLIYQAAELLKVPDLERYGVPDELLVDLAHNAVLDWFTRALPAVREQYRQRTPVTPLGTGSAVYAAGGFTYAAATRTLTYAAGAFTTANIGMSVAIAITGPTVYTGTITGVTDSTDVVLSGTELPPADIASGSAVALLIWARPADIALGPLNLAEITMESGIPSNIRLESDLLGDIQFLSNDQARDVAGDLTGYPDAVFATLYADTIGIIEGASVSSIGNLTLVAIVNPNKQTSLTGAPYVPDQYVPVVVRLLAAMIAPLVDKQFPPDEPRVDADVKAFSELKQVTK